MLDGWANERVSCCMCVYLKTYFVRIFLFYFVLFLILQASDGRAMKDEAKEGENANNVVWMELWKCCSGREREWAQELSHLTHAQILLKHKLNWHTSHASHIAHRTSAWIGCFLQIVFIRTSFHYTKHTHQKRARENERTSEMVIWK